MRTVSVRKPSSAKFEMNPSKITRLSFVSGTTDPSGCKIDSHRCVNQAAELVVLHGSISAVDQMSTHVP
jgi:hypothetical protein